MAGIVAKSVQVGNDEVVYVIASVLRPLSQILVQEILDLIHDDLLKIDLRSNIVSCPRQEVLLFLKFLDQHAVSDDVENHGAAHENNGNDRDKLLISLQSFDHVSILLRCVAFGELGTILGRHELANIRLSWDLEPGVVDSNRLIRDIISLRLRAEHTALVRVR